MPILKKIDNNSFFPSFEHEDTLLLFFLAISGASWTIHLTVTLLETSRYGLIGLAPKIDLEETFFFSLCVIANTVLDASWTLYLTVSLLEASRYGLIGL